MKYILLFFFPLFLFSVEIDDWTYFKEIGAIHSIVSGDRLIHFIASNGIYSYDDIEEKYYYDFDLSNQIDFNNKIYHFYFDSNTDIYWLIDEYGIKIKHSFHDFWRDISYRKFNIIDVSEIINIGSSSNYVWVKLFDRVIPLDPITGRIIDSDDVYNEINNIDWSGEYDNYGYRKEIDLSNYVIFDKWDIQHDRIVGDKGEILIPTAFLEDSFGNIWVGTDKGIIFRGSSYSHRLEIVDFSLKFSNVTVGILDQNMNWWFGDSQFLRTGIRKNRSRMFSSDYGSRKNQNILLSKWNEYEDKWKHIEADNSMLIQNLDVNDILSINNIVYIGTMDGLLIFDELDNDWVKLDKELYDKAIWDIEYYNNSIYIGTARGFDEISSISNQLIKSEDLLSELLRESEIYDLLIYNNVMYIASEKGLFQKYFDVDNYTLLSDKIFKDIEVYKNSIFGSDTDLWEINLIDFNIERFAPDVLNFSILDNFIWLNHFNYCELLNIDTKNKWRFDFQNGIPGNIIYNINSKNNKVWFMTNNGVGIYDWKRDNYE